VGQVQLAHPTSLNDYRYQERAINSLFSTNLPISQYLFVVNGGESLIHQAFSLLVTPSAFTLVIGGSLTRKVALGVGHLMSLHQTTGYWKITRGQALACGTAKFNLLCWQTTRKCFKFFNQTPITLLGENMGDSFEGGFMLDHQSIQVFEPKPKEEEAAKPNDTEATF
jgi:hypothetical protein